MSVSARALHDYTARSDKELSFKRGEMLKVVEKSPDGHWWDGLCGSNRGFIPVAYVEIIELELQTPSATSDTAAVPPPPTRKSSMQEAREEEAGKVSEAPVDASIPELPAREGNPEPPKVTVTADAETKEEDEELEEKVSSPEPVKQEPPASKPAITVSSSVKSLSSKFTAPPPPAQVLVSPYRKHVDLSPRKSYDPPSLAGSTEEGISRSASASSGRVSQLAEQLKQKNPPPPTKPRPHSHTVSPGADHAKTSFHITPHSSTTGSPLQQAQLGSQLAQKPTGKTPSKGRGSRRDKKEERPPLPTKPLVKPPPPAKAPTELRAELQAAVGKRRPTD
jgi:hypothetical protein